MQTSTGEVAAARLLDAEDATMRQVLAWAMDHDAAVALRLAVALAPWWWLRGRLTGRYPLLREAACRAATGGAPRNSGSALRANSADQAGALGHSTTLLDAVADRGPSRVLADALVSRSAILLNTDRLGAATQDARRSLAGMPFDNPFYAGSPAAPLSCYQA